MGKRSTITGYWRARGATESSSGRTAGPTPGVLRITQAVVVDPAAASGTPTGNYIPAGAVIMNIQIVSGHTGGTAPLLDIGLDDGTTPDPDGLVDGSTALTAVTIVDALTASNGAVGALFNGAALTVDNEVIAGTGGGVVGSGTSIAYITYTMSDDGVIND